MKQRDAERPTRPQAHACKGRCTAATINPREPAPADAGHTAPDMCAATPAHLRSALLSPSQHTPRMTAACASCPAAANARRPQGSAGASMQTAAHSAVCGSRIAAAGRALGGEGSCPGPLRWLHNSRLLCGPAGRLREPCLPARLPAGLPANLPAHHTHVPACLPACPPHPRAGLPAWRMCVPAHHSNFEQYGIF